MTLVFLPNDPGRVAATTPLPTGGSWAHRKGAWGNDCITHSPGLGISRSSSMTAHVTEWACDACVCGVYEWYEEIAAVCLS